MNLFKIQSENNDIIKIKYFLPHEAESMVFPGKVCAFTGHRPVKLEKMTNGKKELFDIIKTEIENEIELAIQEGYEYFLSGMALGPDMWAAESVIRAKAEHSEKKLGIFAAIPFIGQERRWNNEDKDTYFKILEQCEAVFIIDENYTKTSYFKRDKFMADRADKLIAVYKPGKKSGTGYTVGCFLQHSKNIVQINPELC